LVNAVVAGLAAWLVGWWVGESIMDIEIGAFEFRRSKTTPVSALDHSSIVQLWEGIQIVGSEEGHGDGSAAAKANRRVS